MDISVIIPCFNSGTYLQDAINSVKFNSLSYEIIVIDDGSTDQQTIDLLNKLELEGIKVIRQENSGPSAARNSGIKVSTGKYLLPLDSDNVIISHIFEEAFGILENIEDISIVYTDAEFFGEKQGNWYVGELNNKNILYKNQIDTCTLIRKSVLEEVGGYDESREIMSNEDWELWIRMLANGKKFYYLKKTGFKYRVVPNSLSSIIARKRHKENLSYLIKKFTHLYADTFSDILEESNSTTSFKQYIRDNRIKVAINIILRRKLPYFKW